MPEVCPLEVRRAAVALLAALACSFPASAGAADEALGLRDRLARRGVEFEVVIQADASANLSGGLRRGTTLRRPLLAAVEVDAERLLGWRGGRFRVSTQSHAGAHGGALVGDAHGFDNVDAEPFDQVSEAWVEQSAWDGRLRLKLGKVDANTEFARVLQGGEFLNSVAGFSPTIQAFPTYPDPAASVNVLAQPAPWLELGAAVYDGATQAGCHGRTGNRGLGTFWGAPDALFAIGEVGVRRTSGGRTGRIAAGAWRHGGDFVRHDGSSAAGTSGQYAVVEQRLSRGEFDAPGIGVFVQWGRADRALAAVDRHLALGLTARAPLPGRADDSAGVLWSQLRFADGRRNEHAIEAFYGAQVRPWLHVKPDVQWVVAPAEATAGHALVATVRIALTF
jgi:porin